MPTSVLRRSMANANVLRLYQIYILRKTVTIYKLGKVSNSQDSEEWEKLIHTEIWPPIEIAQ